MTKRMSTVKSDMTEAELMQFAGVFYEEVSSNVYLVKKNRFNSQQGDFVDGAVIAQELNREDSRVAVKKENGKLIANFNRVMYRDFYADTLNREVL